MRPTRQVLVIGAVVWAIVGGVMALSALPQVDSDARWLVGVASVVFPLPRRSRRWLCGEGPCDGPVSSCCCPWRRRPTSPGR